ncbi:MAG: M15 family metallopeptidase [Methylacidiphilales bacterium]|nr:M15 family metallopeptidase [Candidatus Methylacidiphilales bacterium]
MPIKVKVLKYEALRYLITALLSVSVNTGAEAADSIKVPHTQLVRVQDEIPGILVDLRYAGVRNITHKAIYQDSTAWLRPETAHRLKLVQNELRRQGYQLVIWDAYRPAWAQRKLWEAFPNANFVAPPRQGSRHTRGTSVDVSLADLQGKLVEMPTDHDVFGPKASQSLSLSDISPTARRNALILRNAMFQNKFSGVPAEWWHYDLADWWKYPLIED